MRISSMQRKTKLTALPHSSGKKVLLPTSAEAAARTSTRPVGSWQSRRLLPPRFDLLRRIATFTLINASTMVFQRYLNGLAGLLFPPVCAACRVPLADGESIICAACWYHLPYTQFHKDPANNSARQLWGRVPIKGITAFLYFHDFSRVQQLVHQLKYRNRPDIGILMGQKYGEI